MSADDISDEPGDRGMLLAEPRLTSSKKLTNAKVPLDNRDLIVDEIGKAEEVTSPLGTRSPASDEEFLVIKAHLVKGIWDDIAYKDGATEFGSRASGPASYVNVKTSSGDLDLAMLPTDGHMSFVASVRKGDSLANLVVSNEYQDQIISFRTGAIDGAVSTTAKVPIDKSYKGRLVDGEFVGEFSADISEGILSAFHPLDGWAPKGKLWLTLRASTGWSQPEFWRTGRDLRATWSAVSNGTKLTNNAREGARYGEDELNADDWPVFAVEPGMRSFDITVRPSFEYVKLGLAGHGPYNGTMKPMTFIVTFPEK